MNQYRSTCSSCEAIKVPLDGDRRIFVQQIMSERVACKIGDKSYLTKATFQEENVDEDAGYTGDEKHLEKSTRGNSVKR